MEPEIQDGEWKIQADEQHIYYLGSICILESFYFDVS